ncbi:MAG TPA: carboxypeptidase regulatory-like domain-containing protein [bacterium]|nr:carboxypeptidase regulatory-like domain-containing protein [bacterium]
MLAVLVVLVFLPELGAVQDPKQYRWSNLLGPPGGLGYDTRIDPRDPNIVFTTDQWAGMCKSYDGGYTWYPKNEGITSRYGPSLDSIPIFCCRIDPYDSNIVWCGTFGMRGVYKSFDAGETWVKMDNGIPDLEAMSFRSFTIDPSDTDIVYTGVEVPVIGKNRSRGMIFKTVNGGESWFNVLECDALVRHIMINPIDTNIVYTATGIFDRWDVRWEGILKTVDGGETWFPVNNGLLDENGEGSLVVGGLTIHPDDPDILFCATGRHQGFGSEPNPRHGSVLKTVNGGASWATISPGYHCWNAVEVDCNDPNIVYASCEHWFARSYDGGETWRMTALGLPGVYSGVPITITIDPTDPDKVFVNSYTGGLYLSLDAGGSWTDAMNGFTGSEMTDVSMDPHNPSVVFAVGRPGPFKSVDGGLTWVGTGSVQGRYQPRPEWSAVCVKPDEPNVVLAADQFYGELYRSEDWGESWEIVLAVMPTDQVSYPYSLHGFKAIAFAPSDTSIIYVGARLPDKTIEFERTTPFDTTRPSMGIYRSTDGGDSWLQMNDGLQDTTKNINGIVVHPQDPDIAYACTLNSGIYKTVDGGQHWMSARLGVTRNDIRVLAIDPVNPEVLYAGAENAGIFKTVDGGFSWTQVNVGIDAEATVRGIAVDPLNSDRVYLGDWHTGAYVSEDAGGVWRHINAGLDNRAITALDISADGSVLYTSTQGGGVFRLGEVPTSATLTGRILDAVSGEPVPAADVSLFPTVATVHTDGNGEFSFPKLRARTYDLSVSAPTYKPYKDNNLMLLAGETQTVYIALCKRLYPALIPSVGADIFYPGDDIHIEARLEHKGPSVRVDLYLALATQDALLFFSAGGFSPEPSGFPFFAVTGVDLSFSIADVHVSEETPSGAYMLIGAAAVPDSFELYSMVRVASFQIASQR